ncbi:MAG: thioredoxin family protein [Panacagrimonas sp.]
MSVLRVVAGCVLALGLCAPAQAEVVSSDLKAALASAETRRVATLVKFRAPWCYSCYYMERHVHAGPEWDALKRRAVVVDLDADSPEGAAQMKSWDIKPLPAYVVLDGGGREIGRVLGEQRPRDFFRQIDALLAPGASLDALRAKAAAGGAKGLSAASAALATFYARNDAASGIAWFYDLPGAVRRTYEPDATLKLHLARLRLMQAQQAGDRDQCAAAAAQVFEAAPSCERPYELSRYRSCAAEANAAVDALERAQLAPMQALVETRVFGAGPACADERSLVMGLVDLQRRSRNEDAGQQLLRRAATRVERHLAQDLGRDRAAADNLRLYLETLGDWPAYDQLMPRLVAAWPDDHVYAFRYGRSLLERDRPSEALPYLERAARHAYGQNRLRVAEQRVKALKRLGEMDQAKQVAAEAFKANGPWFPELVEAVKSQL